MKVQTWRPGQAVPEGASLMLRHGEKAKLGGHHLADPLSDSGRREAVRLGRELSAVRWARIHTSPVSRCSETAKALREGLGRPDDLTIDETTKLGDPGPFVVQPARLSQLAGSNERLMEILQQHARGVAHPCLSSLEDGARMVLSLVAKREPAILISHDAIIGSFAAAFGLEPDWPQSLHGLAIVEPAAAPYGSQE